MPDRDAERPDLTTRDALYEHYARIGQALASPMRLRLLALLGHGDKAVEVLAKRLGQSVASTSAHLKVLRQAHLVSTQREGRRIRYSLAGREVLQLWLALRAVAERQLPEVRELTRLYQEDPASLERLDTDELVRRAGRGDILLVDLRPPDEYAAGHLPAARSIPFADLETRAGELPEDARIVAYCRGPWCVMAFEGVAQLRARGLEATRLAEGPLEWRAQGRRLATGDEDDA